MNLIVDVIALAILFLSAHIGYRKGFIKAFFDFFSGLISFIVASFFARPVSDYLSNTILKPRLTGFFAEKISAQLSSYIEGANPLESVPGFVSFASRLGVSQDELQLFWERSGNRIDVFTLQLSDSISSIFCRTVGYFVSMVFIIFSVFCLIKILVKFFDLIAKLPLLNAPNRLLGIVFGFCFGIFSVLLFVSALIVLEPFIKNSDSAFLNVFSFEKTYLLRYFYTILIR